MYVDDSIEQQYELLTSLLLSPEPRQTIPPWSRPIDTVASQVSNTPDPTSFPDDILTYPISTHDEAIIVYLAGLETHVTPGIKNACLGIMDLLASDLALSVFVPTEWTGIKLKPYSLEIKARACPIRKALYRDAKAEFDRMRTYFYAPSTSTIASPLVVAPKATTPFIRLCGDYRQINSFICIPQEPIPHVQQALAKAAGWKFFVDLDMTNSFYHITLDMQSSLLISVSTPWGLFRPKFLNEGVGPASGILQAIVRKIFADLDDWIILIFDNFLILADSYGDATAKLATILQRSHDNRLVLKIKKSWIGTNIVTFFSYEVKPRSWGLSQSRKNSISDMLFPTTQKQMQSIKLLPDSYS